MDDDPTNPRNLAPLTARFRCRTCELEAVVLEPVETAPCCNACERFMAPVNDKRVRGQA